MARQSDLYERMLPDVKADMDREYAKFKNNLNVVILSLKLRNSMPPLLKLAWITEAILLLLTMFIAGMWFKDPDGNYEPVVVGLGLVFSLVGVLIKFTSSKKT